MGLMATIKAQQAMRAHGNGDLEKAKTLYEEALAKGLDSARPMLGYALLLIREGSYDKAMSLLLKTQNCPDLTPEQKSQLYVDYAACCEKKGELEKGIRLLEKQHRRAPIGLTYQTLGYLYVEKYAGEKPIAPVPSEKEEKTGEACENKTDEVREVKTDEVNKTDEVRKTQEEMDAEWQAGIENMFAFIKESIDYDDEDAICLDNLGQAYFRVTHEEDKAREWFEKAHEERSSQIDTLWFLSRYDLKEGNADAALEKLETASNGRFSPLNFCTKEMVDAEIERIKNQEKR